MPAVFTQTGQNWVVDKISNTVATTMQYIAWGTDGTAETEGDTALAAETTAQGSDRTLGTLSQPQPDTYRVVGTLEANAGKTIAEVGLFDASTGGVMMIRGTHAGIPLLTGDRIEYTLDLVIDKA